MTAPKRTATIRWLNFPPGGAPRLSVGSHSIAPVLSLNSDPDATSPLATSPGELLAGAIGSALAWFVAERLVDEGTQAHELVTYVTLTFSGQAGGSDAVLTGVVCELSGRVANVEEPHLDAVAKAAMTECREALGMRTEGIAVTVGASLASGDQS